VASICGKWLRLFYTVLHITLSHAEDFLEELIELHIQCCDEVYDTFHGLNRKSTFNSHPHSHVHLQVSQIF
jgi:hypothetical protein